MESKLILKGNKQPAWGNTTIYRIDGKTDTMLKSWKIRACPDWLYYKCITGDSTGAYNSYIIWLTRGDWSRECFAWGYNGIGPALLSVCILAMYANYLGALTQHGFLQHTGPELGTQFVKDNFKAFTAEVVAKLPDEWTLTYEDITAWLKEKGINPDGPINPINPTPHS